MEQLSIAREGGREDRERSRMEGGLGTSFEQNLGEDFPPLGAMGREHSRLERGRNGVSRERVGAASSRNYQVGTKLIPEEVREIAGGADKARIQMHRSGVNATSTEVPLGLIDLQQRAETPDKAGYISQET
eukprot:c30647_g1_i1 orf=122-514(-)